MLILAVDVDRLGELTVAKRNARSDFTNGDRKFRRSYCPVIVVLATNLPLGCVGESWTLHRTFVGWLG